MRFATVVLVLLACGWAKADAGVEQRAHEEYVQAQKAFDAADYSAALAGFRRS